jgi:hypothetical protein
MKQMRILLGGKHHDFDGFAAAITPIYQHAGYQVEATYDRDMLLGLADAPVNVILLYTCFGRSGENDQANEGLTAAHTEALANWVQNGGGLLAAHAATVSGQTDAAFRRLVGGAFVSHPPQFTFTLYPMFEAHPITGGVESFAVHDEFYIQHYDPGIEVHMAAFDRGVGHPMVWSRAEGEGRVAHIAVGHGPRTWRLDPYQQLMAQAAAWLAL